MGEPVPKQLFNAGISREEWEQIWDAVEPMTTAATSSNAALALANSLLKSHGINVILKQQQALPIGLEMNVKRNNKTKGVTSDATTIFSAAASPFGSTSSQ